MLPLFVSPSASVLAQSHDEVGRPQWLIGVGLGAATSSSVGGLYARDEFVRRWPVVGLSANVVAECAPIPSLLWIESGVGIVQLGHGYKFFGGATDASYTERVTFLSVPVVVKTYVPAAFGGLTVGFGPSFVVAVSTGGALTDHTTGVTSRLADEYFDDYLRLVNGTLAATAAYEFPTPIGRFGLELSVDLHLLCDFDWGLPADDNRFVSARVHAIYRLGFQ